MAAKPATQANRGGNRWGKVVAEARYSHSPPPETAEFPLRLHKAPLAAILVK
jgi:hypothetical protein